MTFDLTNPFHVGYIVADVEIAMEQLSAATGVTWHPPQVFALEITMGDDRVDFDVTFTYSKEGPVQIEVAQGPAPKALPCSRHHQDCALS